MFDGVVANFSRAFEQLLIELHGNKFPEKHWQPTDWDYTESGYSKEEMSAAWEALHKIDRFWEAVPSYLDSIEAILNFFKDPAIFQDVEVFYVTKRAYSSGGSIMKQTTNWLVAKRVFWPNCSVISVPDGYNKPDIYKALGIHFSIDDYYENLPKRKITLVDGKIHQAYLLERSWNKDYRKKYPKVLSVKNLKEYFDIVKEA